MNGIASVQESCDFAVDNCYDEVFNAAERYVKAKDRISEITNELYIHIENEKIEEVLTELEKVIESSLYQVE